jgi:NADP-dependent 3-hydroxy acid dehydrogenase YdfG
VHLDGKVFVVAGGGVAGEAVAGGLLRRGATVAVMSRAEKRLKAIREEFDTSRLHGFVIDVMDFSKAEAARDQLTAMLGPIDGVVAALGGWWEGPSLSRLDPKIWQRILTDNLTSHFMAARLFLPMLAERRESVYVMLGGVGAEIPIPHAGPVSVAGAAQTRLLEVLVAERLGVRLHEVRIMTPIVTRHWSRTDREPEWLTGEQVGDYVASVVEPGFPKSDQLVLHVPD